MNENLLDLGRTKQAGFEILHSRKILDHFKCPVKKFPKSNKCPEPNKNVLGGKLAEIDKNILDYYQADIVCKTVRIYFQTRLSWSTM